MNRRLAALAVATGILIAGCSSSGGGRTSSTSPSGSSTSASSAAQASGGEYPVTVSSCGQQVTFEKAPTRAVTSDIDMFEDMVALGLQSHMAGTFGLDGYGTDGTSAVPARDAAAYKQVHVISKDYLALEPLVGVEPDFLFSGWNYGLKVSSTLTPDNLAKYGIKTYVLEESCAHVQSSKKAVSIDNTYTDLTNLGKIFNVRARAAQVVASMKAKVAAVQAKVAGETPKKVFLYDSGTDAPFTAPGLATPDALISLAGGINTMHSLKQTWTSVSWEQAIATKPDCIVVNEYGTPTYAQKVKFLETSPITRNLPAVRNRCFVGLDYAQLTPGPYNADAVEAIAKTLYPSRF